MFASSRLSGKSPPRKGPTSVIAYVLLPVIETGGERVKEAVRDPMSHDKQLGGFKLRALQQKQRLDQALNAKEFALLAGVSYAIAREWLHTPGFPTLSGLVFWQDFVLWRRLQTGLQAVTSNISTSADVPVAHPQSGNGKIIRSNGHWPERAAPFALKAS